MKLLFHLTNDDTPYIGYLKQALAGKATGSINNKEVVALTALQIACKDRGFEAVISTCPNLLRLVTKNESAKISEYAGSLFEIAERELKILFIDPLDQLVTTSTGIFIFRRYLQKVLAPETFLVIPEFRWQLFEAQDAKEIMRFCMESSIISLDIETKNKHFDVEKLITCAGFTAMKIDIETDSYQLLTVVVPFTSEYNILFYKSICGTHVPKVLQNGKYDMAYLLRYGIPVYNYAFDTINMFHSWYCELPKSIAFTSSFMLRNFPYWKNESDTSDLYFYYQYNAKDTFSTLLIFIAELLEIPEYAIRNYLIEFPNVFPCILAEATGIKYNATGAARFKEIAENQLSNLRKQLGVLVGNENYNPNSPQQTARLWHILGSKDITSTSASSAEKVSSRHPLNERIISEISNYRETSKLIGAYLKDSINWRGRVFYSLNPHGTDTGRLASKESHFWCGLQIQNIPRDEDIRDENTVNIKDNFIADKGFYLGEADFKQAETFDTAYITGDENLIKTINDPSVDFHGLNASKFFGIDYKEIVKSWIDEAISEWVHKTLNKPLRDLSKRTNHGANYNMGPDVMLQTMGVKKVLKAKELLKLPISMSPKDVCEYLLKQFDRTYPTIRSKEPGGYHYYIIEQVRKTKMLVGATGWTRYCFNDPSKSKPALNAYAAHNPQSLNAMTLNKAFQNVFYKVWLPNQANFKLHAQIHDSILFSYRIGHSYLAKQVHDCMLVPTEVRDISGKTRVLTVPVDVKGEASRWSDLVAMRFGKD